MGTVNLLNACYYATQNLMSSHMLSKNINIKLKIYIFAGCFVWV
jgi:hypothetical protein